MPIYEYRCSKCGNEFELIKSFSEVNDKEKCKECGEDAQKIVSNVSIAFKGNGFYKTDN